MYALTAAGDRAGRIGLASLELARVTVRVSEDRGTLWTEPQVVYQEQGAIPRLGPDSFGLGLKAAEVRLP